MTKANWIAAVLVACSTCAFADSDMDPTWDGGGYTTTNVGTGIDAQAYGLAIDSVGRVVLAGEADQFATDPLFVAVRYRGDQTPGSTGFEDVDFHNNVNNYAGISFSPAGINGVHGLAVQIGVNDSVVMAGDCENPVFPFDHSFCLARLTDTGAIDGSFGSAGTVVTSIGLDNAFPKAMAKDSAGGFLVAGFSSDPVSPNPVVFTVVRYDASGNQDLSFGVNGVARVADPNPFPVSPGNPGSDDSAYAIAVDSDDSIVVAGTVYDMSANNGGFGVARLTKMGAMDPTFNAGKMAVVGFPNGAGANAVGIDSLHRPIVGGIAYVAGNPNASSTMALARFTAAGVADATFGSSGKVSAPLAGCSEATLNGLAVDRSNRVFAAGYCKISVPIVAQELALVHFNTNGGLDATYGNNGMDLQFFGFANAALTSIVLDSLGRPVVAGSRIDAGSGKFGFVVNRHDYVFSHGFD